MGILKNLLGQCVFENGIPEKKITLKNGIPEKNSKKCIPEKNFTLKSAYQEIIFILKE